MAQVKIYGTRANLSVNRDKLSELIHSSLVEAIKLPADKKAQRFFYMEPEDFYYPPGRTANYTIIEISMIEGRTVETKKRLLKLLMANIQQGLDFSLQDIEINISETPRSNWAFRGFTADELELNYKIEV
jgi:hypothetical protein